MNRILIFKKTGTKERYARFIHIYHGFKILEFIEEVKEYLGDGWELGHIADGDNGILYTAD